MTAKTGICLILKTAFLVAVLANVFYGQAIDAEIKVGADGNLIEVAANFPDAGDIRNLTFEREFAGVTGLADRISGIRAVGKDGREIDLKMFAPGEFVAAEPIKAFSYAVRVDPPAESGQAHISWLKDGRGVIYLADLLPLALGNGSPAATVRIAGAKGLVGGGDCSSIGVETFQCSDRGRAAFPISAGFRTLKTKTPGLLLTVEGTWGFDDAAAAAEADKVFAEYKAIFGGVPKGRFDISIMSFAGDVPPGKYEADTRGTSIVILSSDTPFKSQSLQRLSSLLRHEMFHLWLPNGVALSGKYDWFYEGAAIYMANRLGVAMNRTRFDDLVGSLSTAVAFDRTAKKGLSLAGASDGRWDGGGTTLYARGMLAAFILDLELLKRSKIKLSLDDVLRKLFTTHDRRNASKVEATPAIIEAFAGFESTDKLAAELLERAEPLDLTPFLENSGFELSDGGRGLKAKEKPSSREKAILNKLGYNNWRKLSLR